MQEGRAVWREVLPVSQHLHVPRAGDAVPPGGQPHLKLVLAVPAEGDAAPSKHGKFPLIQGRSNRLRAGLLVVKRNYRSGVDYRHPHQEGKPGIHAAQGHAAQGVPVLPGHR